MVFSEADFFESSVDLEHFGIVNCAFLPNAGVSWSVKVDYSKTTVIPVKHTRNANNAIDIQLVITDV